MADLSQFSSASPTVTAQGPQEITLKIDKGSLESLLKDGHIKLHRTDEETHIAVQREVS